MFINIMSDSRYFKVEPQIYEQVRLSLDLATSMPEGETVYEPLITAPKSSDGNVLLSIRTEHCNTEPYFTTILELLSSTNAVEVDRAEFEVLLPKVETSLTNET